MSIYDLSEQDKRLLACDIVEHVLSWAGGHRAVCERVIAVSRAYARGEATADELAKAHHDVSTIEYISVVTNVVAWATESCASICANPTRAAIYALDAISVGAANTAEELASEGHAITTVAAAADAARQAERAWQAERLKQYERGEAR